jgi:hypothetical protein
MRRAVFALAAPAALALPLPALACSPCRSLVFASFLDANFAARLLVVLLPVLLLVCAGIWLYRSGATHASHP